MIPSFKYWGEWFDTRDQTVIGLENESFLIDSMEKIIDESRLIVN